MDRITYNLKLNDGKEYTFEVDIDRKDRREETNKETHAFWTKLDYNRCSNCPLTVSTCKYCPAALDIEEIAKNSRTSFPLNGQMCGYTQKTVHTLKTVMYKRH